MGPFHSMATSCSMRHPNGCSQVRTFKVQDCQHSFKRSLRKTGGIVRMSAVPYSSVRQGHQGRKICPIKTQGCELQLLDSAFKSELI